jgi:hypothetical protein
MLFFCFESNFRKPTLKDSLEDLSKNRTKILIFMGINNVKMLHQSYCSSKVSLRNLAEIKSK